MNKNQYMVFKNEISKVSKKELIKLAIILKVLWIAFKKFGRILNLNGVLEKGYDEDFVKLISFLKKQGSFDKKSIYKLLLMVEHQIGADYYIQVKSHPSILDEVLAIVRSILGDKVVDKMEIGSLGLKVKSAEKIYSRSLDGDLEKLLGKSL